MDALTHLSMLDAPAGRMQQVRAGAGDVHAIVDYAHTPDALRKVLETLRTVRSSGPAAGAQGNPASSASWDAEVTGTGPSGRSWRSAPPPTSPTSSS